MGGTVSKLDENDWNAASGGIRFPSHTIDGSRPTSRYCIYTLAKRTRFMINQREFDITDDQHNLLYTTKAVPKTLAGFDVLGCEMGDYKLRVVADLSRRYWTVYRYNIPTFPGQLPDAVESEKLAAELSERQVQQQLSASGAAAETPVLYRKAMIFVSWSRYTAISAMFGPFDEAHDLLVKEDEDEHSNGDKNDVACTSMKSHTLPTNVSSAADVDAVADTVATATARLDIDDHTVAVHPFATIPATNGDEDALRLCHRLAMPLTTSDSCSSLDPITACRLPCSNETKIKPHSQPLNLFCNTSIEISDDHVDENRAPRTEDRIPQPSLSCSEFQDTELSLGSSPLNSMPSNLSLNQWWQAQSESFLKQSASFRDQSKVLIEQHTQLILDKSSYYLSPSLLGMNWDPRQGELQLNDESPLLQCQEVYNRIIGNHQTCRVDKKQVLRLLQQDRDCRDRSTSHQDNNNNRSSNFSGINQGEVIPSSRSSSSLLEPTFCDHKKQSQPLVGYWCWENTLLTHQMKMHVASDADLGLHVILAVIVNQVRYERNAIALSV